MEQDKIITSLQNPRIKEVLKIRERKSKTDSIIVEGIREILRAQEAGVVFRELYFCKDFLGDSKDEGIISKMGLQKTRLFELTKEAFAKISFGERKEGLIAVCQRPKWSLDRLTRQENPIFVVVERVEKPGNLGAILRTCDGAGVSALILCDRKVDSYHPNVVRASIGTVFSVKVIEATNEEALQFLKQNKIKSFAATPHAKMVYTKIDFKIPLAVVLGSEEEGLSDFWMKNADLEIKIPMRGKADSLNVSNTAAILIYEALRQRSP